MTIESKKILVLGGDWPCIDGNTQAANVVVHEVVRVLAQRFPGRVGFSCITAEPSTPSEVVRQQMTRLAANGVELLPAVTVPRKRRGRLAMLLRGFIAADPEVLIHGVGQQECLAPVMERFKPDVVVTVWSELATALVSQLSLPKFTYYGNPDHKVLEARLRFQWESRKESARANALSWPPLRSVLVNAVERAHLKVLRTQTAIAEVAQNDAIYYLARGLRQTFYLGNMWVMPNGAHQDVMRARQEQTAPFKIVGNVGNVSTTGNIHGIRTIATEIVPRLKRSLGEGRFEVHLFGGGELPASLKALVRDPHIKVRGFVPDLDAEMRSAAMFLVANNSHKFIVGHTRFLHAWSLGCCVVGYAESAKAMPELVNGHNVLLGNNAEEVTALIEKCVSDQQLRQKIGAQGFADCRAKFDPQVVVSRFIEKLDESLSHRATGVAS